MKPGPKTPVRILVKTSGKSHGQAAIHLYNPHPRRYYGSQSHAGSVCYSQVSPSWDGWELRDGTLEDVMCAKCRRRADGAYRRVWRFIARACGLSIAPVSEHGLSIAAVDRAAIERDRWERWTGQPHPGQGAR